VTGDLFPLPRLIAKDLTREVIDSDYVELARLKGIPDSNGSMSIAAPVGNNTGKPLLICSLYTVDQLPFMIALEPFGFQPGKRRHDFFPDLLKRFRSIDALIPLPQQVQVRAVQYQDFHRWKCSVSS
jgi:hypothetical protein